MRRVRGPGAHPGGRGPSMRWTVLASAVLLALIVGTGLVRLGGTASSSGAGRELSTSIAAESAALAETATDAVVADGASAIDAVAEDDAGARAGGDAVSVVECEGDVPRTATGLLDRYREEGDCSLARSGYIDLLGKSWSCTVIGPGWVDTCLVQEEAGVVMRCKVTVVRMGVESWEASIGGT